MCRIRPDVVFLLLMLMSVSVSARDADYVWNSRCEQCHGDSRPFAGKYLWDMQGKLEGQHHIDDLKLFMSNHYIPDHDLDMVLEMLSKHANSFQRYINECSECHGDATAFVKESLWVSRTGITVMETGDDFVEFLPKHRELSAEDVTFFMRLFSRLVGKPIPMETELKFR